MNRTTRQVALAAATSLATAGMLMPQASAAPSKVTGGKTTLTVTAKSKKMLKRHGVKLVARKPGTAKGRTKVTAKVAGRKMTLATLKRNKAKVKSSAKNRSVSGIKLRLTKKAVKRINKRLHARSITRKGSFGKLTVQVRRPAGQNGGTTTTPANPDTSTSVAKIGFAPAVSQALGEAGLTPSALPGAELLPDGTFNLPVTAVDIDPDTGTGTIDLAGGIALGDGENAVMIDKPQIVLDGDDSGLYAAVNGIRVKLADLDSSGVAEAIQSGSTQLSDLLLMLSPEGAAALNQAGGVSLPVPGTPFGDVSVTI